MYFIGWRRKIEICNDFKYFTDTSWNNWKSLVKLYRFSSTPYVPSAGKTRLFWFYIVSTAMMNCRKMCAWDCFTKRNHDRKKIPKIELRCAPTQSVMRRDRQATSHHVLDQVHAPPKHGTEKKSQRIACILKSLPKLDICAKGHMWPLQCAT